MRGTQYLLPLILLFGCQEPIEKEKAIRPVKALQIQDPASVSGRAFPGRTRAEDRVNLSFRVSGPLVQRQAKVGDIVKKDEILAQIDPRDFEVKLRESLGQLEKTKAQLTFAEGDYERAIRIQNEDPGAISERLVDQKRELRNQLRAQAESQLAEVDGAKDELDYTYLRSPFDGIIVATYVQNFEHVQAKQSIMRILDTTRVEMVVDIPENLISLIPYVTEISVTLDPFPDREISAKVKEIGTEASTTTRTFPVTLVMDQPSDIQVLAGMAGEARLVKATYPDLATRGMEIPLNALFSMDEDKKDYVWIIDEATMQVSQREVQLGRMTNTGVVIYQGIQPGEWIVTAGVHFLREGQQVDFISEDIESIK